MSALHEAALRYAELGYAVFPCVPGTKTPLTEHGHLDATTEPEQIERWWTQRPNANIGIPTGGLVVIDVDEGATWLADQPDRELALAIAPLSLTANAGRQYLFRQPPGKNWRNTSGRLAGHVDTRADGGYVVVAPSVLEGGKVYRWAERLELDDPPESLPEPPGWLTEELDRLAEPPPTSTPCPGRGSRRATLAPVASASVPGNAIPSGQRNATLARLAGTMRRVGMSGAEIVAALERANIDRCTPPLDNREVQRIAASVANYAPDEVAVAMAENHWDQMYADVADEDEVEPAGCDPGPLPDHLLRIPGFVSEVMDHCLATAPYPNVALAFGGALVLQAFLASRKVRDPGDNRTNLYLLGLAHSSAGKDWPRKLNTEIAHRVGLADGIGERFASGEGIQDALFITPSMLFQTDEIDGLLQSINKARDNRHESIMGTLLTMYSSSNSVYPMRRKAGRESPGAIDQPSLTVFGTAIPNHYYAALSERMLTNGMFARMLILESSRRGAGQEPVIREIPNRILQTAAWWADFQPRTGNLQSWHPVPVVVEQTDEARQILIDARRQAEREYEICEGRNDAVGTTVWGRVSEQSRKLALLHAISVNHTAPTIDAAAVEWAVGLVMHQTRRMLFMAGRHVSETEFDQRCKRVLEALAAWQASHGDRWMPYRDLSRKFRWNRREHEDVREALLDQERIETDSITTSGRPKLVYRLRAAGRRAT